MAGPFSAPRPRLCQVFRYWLAGPKSGKTEILIDELPGYPTTSTAPPTAITGSLVGIRSPVYDLASRNTGFRRRMVKQIPPDEWLGPGLNYGCVIKFDEEGMVLKFFVGSRRSFPPDHDIHEGAQGLPLLGRA